MPVAKCVRPSCQRTCDTQSGWCAACQPKVLKLAALRAVGFDDVLDETDETGAPIVDDHPHPVDPNAADGHVHEPLDLEIASLLNRLNNVVQSEDWTQWSRKSFEPFLFSVANMLEILRYDVSVLNPRPAF